MKKKIFNLFMATVCMISMLAVSIPTANAAVVSLDDDISFTSANDIMLQYVCQNQNDVKLINQNQVYSYDVSKGTMTKEYTFPVNESINTSAPQGNKGYGLSAKESAFVNENTGILYYAYDKYQRTYTKEGECIEIVVYDLENSRVINTMSIQGEILAAVGGDNNGNIYVATRSVFSELENERSVIMYSADGELISRQNVENEFENFGGFCDDGTFIYVERYMAYSSYGYQNLMGLLRKGKSDATEITFDETAITYVKNIYFGNYYNCAEIVNNEYITTFVGYIIPISNVSKLKLSLSRSYEMGDDDQYLYNAGTNVVIVGDDVYSLSDNNKIMRYSLSDGTKKSYYESERKIFNFKKCGNSLITLQTDGNDNFYYEKIEFSDFKDIVTTTVNMNTFDVYNNRTKEDIVKKYSEAVPDDYNADLYETTGSSTAPYKESTLTQTTKDNALKFSNYLRWLGGLTPFESADELSWSNAAKGAVLLDASEFSHSPSQPEDMDDEFYNSAYEGTSSSNIANCYIGSQKSILFLARLFMNDTGYTVPGHRTTFLTRYGNKIAYGMFNYYACQTVEYEGNPNPQGTSTVDNNETAYAWPAPGYFPENEISPSAYWTVNLNTDKITTSEKALEVTITDIDTGETFVRNSTATGLYSTSYWGKFISFAPPETSNGYSDKNYKVTITNLSDSEGMPVVLEYTVNFFSYNGNFVIDGVNYSCDSWGKLTPTSIKGDVNFDGVVNVSDATAIQKYIADIISFNDTQKSLADFNNDSLITIADATAIQKHIVNRD